MDAANGESSAPKGSIALNGHRFDLEAEELLDEAGEHVQLRPQCLGVLRCLARKAGEVVTKEELMRAVWPNIVVTDDSLVQCIGALRHALHDDLHRVVQTEPKRGYRLRPSRQESVEYRLRSRGEPGHDGAPIQDVRFTTSSDGVRIAYASSGRGVPVVRAARFISHLDYDLTSLTEGPIQQAVARRYRLIRFDQRGQGLSDRHVGAGTLEDSVRDLVAVVDAEGLSRFVLWSIGGGTSSAIRFAARYPERVERLILSAGWARGMAVRKDERWAVSGEAHMQLYKTLWNDPYSNVRRLGGFARQYPGATLEQRNSYDELLMNACSGASAESALRASMHFDVIDDLGSVRCPTLVTRSQRDRVTPFEEIRLMVAGIPHARLVTLDSDNHMPLPQEPAFGELVRVIDEFIDEGDGTRRAAGNETATREQGSPTPGGAGQSCGC